MRLYRLASDKTHEGPFGEGSVVKVDKVCCGIVRWLGIVKSGNSELLSAGNVTAVWHCNFTIITLVILLVQYLANLFVI